MTKTILTGNFHAAFHDAKGIMPLIVGEMIFPIFRPFFYEIHMTVVTCLLCVFGLFLMFDEYYWVS